MGSFTVIPSPLHFLDGPTVNQAVAQPFDVGALTALGEIHFVQAYHGGALFVAADILDTSSGLADAIRDSNDANFAAGGGEAGLTGSKRAARRGSYSAAKGAQQLSSLKAAGRIFWPAAVVMTVIDFGSDFRSCW